MSDSTSVRDRYLQLIDDIVDTTLQGKIRSQEQVYRMLVQNITSGTGEIFERCLLERITATKAQLETKIKATRILRALETIQKQWERWLEENQVNLAIATAVEEITQTERDRRFLAFLRVIDPNRSDPLTLTQLEQLAQALQQQSDKDLQHLADGINRGLKSWDKLAANLVSWMYEPRGTALGFSGTSQDSGPWGFWGKLINSPLIQQLFQTLAQRESLIEFASKQTAVETAAWVELTVVLQCLQRGLVQFFDQRIYNSELGANLSISTFLTFAVIWSQLANGLNSPTANTYAQGCFQIMLQILRTFTQREYFPLYGGVFAFFGGENLREALNYLDEPLREVEGTQEKARILTLLGYSQKAQGRLNQAKTFHQEALLIAGSAGDRVCEIANLNHLSRTFIAEKNYNEAVNSSQRALMFSRQYGDSLGQANALANLGYSEVLKAIQNERPETEVYEAAINYLEQGLQAAIRLNDGQSKALCYSSLGIAQLFLAQPSAAIESLSKGLEAAKFSGDLYLQGLNYAYLAEGYKQVNSLKETVTCGCLGMYLLAQINADEWRQPAGLLIILQGQAPEKFKEALQLSRREIIKHIGIDGYDYIPQLLQKYKEEG
ncbi:tetratricopeptide repeat protein [Oscillatoria salina]|uniref:tetratricopeptide repeat protein n=1 Tax=Oscillatoria salina TaxID=331517 RepID=UPI001CC9C5FC|nr:tetratricopeptide repeat protein [Oscillatoria salina]MBZ8179149.1 tetratricopeptide repeat protein [Oscillatoria salina IIICB1]